MKKTERQKAKDKAWRQFSIYIRTRDCIRFSGNPELGKCVTCKLPKHFKQLQAGHFIPGRGNAVLFDERLVYSQCIGCNGNPPMGKGGNYIEYVLFMMNEEGYTKEEIEEFNALKHQTVQYKIHDFERIEAEYKQKTEELCQELKLSK